MQKGPYYEDTIKERRIFDGKLLRVSELTVTLPNGKQSTREVVYHPGAVAILAEPQPNHIVCVEQFRKATGETLLEIPAGKLEPGEAPAESARRELIEETGYICDTLTQLYEFYTSPGFADEKITLFYASGLRSGTAKPDEDEFLGTLTLSRAEVRMRVDAGQVRDAKTLIALLWWLRNGES